MTRNPYIKSLVFNLGGCDVCGQADLFTLDRARTEWGLTGHAVPPRLGREGADHALCGRTAFDAGMIHQSHGGCEPLIQPPVQVGFDNL